MSPATPADPAGSHFPSHGVVVRKVGDPAPSGPPRSLGGPPALAPGRHHAEPDPLPASPEPAQSRFTFSRRKQLAAAVGFVAVASIAVPLVFLWTSGMPTTGTTVMPPSRGYLCRSGSVEHDWSAACRAAAAVRPVGGTGSAEGLEAGTGVGIPDVARRHREVIPDARLCSAGRERYRGLDLARSDWPTTALTSGGTTTLEYRLNERHAGTLRFYLTRVTYDPTQPLTWGALDPNPIGTVTGAPGPDRVYRVRVRLPARTGRHLIYTIWERSGDSAALYACSDVMFGGTAGSGTPTPVPIPSGLSGPSGPVSPTPSAGGSPRPDASVDEPTAEWKVGAHYSAGDLVTYDGVTYRCAQRHTGVRGWEPPAAPSLWDVAG